MRTAETLVPLPRSEWPQHPRFESQTLLLGSHRGFIEVSELLVAAARSGHSRDRIEAIYLHWIGAMRGHEAYEEQKLYPYLAKRWGLNFEAAEAGHEALHVAHEGVMDALSNRDSEAIAEALAAHHDVLLAHLELEEEQVIPALLQLSPTEFHRYYNGNIRDLLRELDRQH